MKYLIDLLLILLIFIKIVLPNIKRRENKEGPILFVFFIYLSLVYALTLMPFRPFTNILNSDWQFNYNFYAFGDIINSYGPAKREALLNILMLLPFGILLPMIKKGSISLLKVIVYSFLFSLSIETLQLLDPLRSSDITDLITNTIGGIIGYVIFKVFIKNIDKVEKKR